VLIRPDGYIALISDAGDTSAVSDYLAAMAAKGLPIPPTRDRRR
jgi:hypothetical protein